MFQFRRPLSSGWWLWNRVHAAHLVSFIWYLSSHVFSWWFLQSQSILGKCEGLDCKSTSQCAMVLICRFLFFVGAFDSWMAQHSSNVSLDVLQQLCTSRCAMTVRLRCDSIVQFIFKAHFVRSCKASLPFVYFDCAIVLLCKWASFSSWSGFFSSPKVGFFHHFHRRSLPVGCVLPVGSSLL